MMRQFPPIVVASGLAVMLAGCAAVGPMRMGSGVESDSATVCVPQVGDPVIVGDAFRIAGTEAAVINEVTLVGATNVELDAAYLIPIIDGEGAVGSADYPPTDLPGWERAISATDATIEPGRDTTVAVVMHRVDTTEAGHADRLEIRYIVAGRTFVKQNSTRFELNTRCS
jgi:hypothetical protein